MINSGRFFAVGCSFTQYNWPTWADICGLSYEYYENWGACGAGNFYIASKLLECHAKNTITKNDTVVVMFSSVPRIDTYNERWNLRGNILSRKLCKEEEYYLKNVWSIEHAYYTTWASIFNVKLFLNSIGCKYKLFTAFNISPTEGTEYGNILPLSQSDFYKEYNKTLTDNFYYPSMWSWIEENYGKESGYTFLHERADNVPWNDTHPTIKQHAEWCNTFLSEFYTNKLDIELMESKITHSKLADNSIKNFVEFGFKQPEKGILY